MNAPLTWSCYVCKKAGIIRRFFYGMRSSALWVNRAVDPEYYVFNVKLADYLGFLTSVTFITDIFRPNAVPFASDCLPRQTNVY